MKYVFVLLFIFNSSLAWANKVLTVEKPLTLIQGQEFMVPKEAIGAYVLLGENTAEVQFSNKKATIKTKRRGKAVIQVLHTDGSISNYLLEILVDQKVQGLSQGREYKGYNFILNARYTGFQSSPTNNRSLLNSYSGNMILTTRVGDYGKFQGRISYQENFPLYFYVRGDYKKIYTGYGDLNLQLNPYKPTFIQQPRLRQHTAGWDGDQFDLDLWSGQLSPVPNSTNFRVSQTPGVREGLLNSLQDRFSGGRTRYRFDNGDSIFVSYWYNHQNQREVPYIGYNYINKTYGIMNSTTVGNSADAPVFSNKFTYQTKNRSKFTLQRVNLLYEIAEKGFDNLLFKTILPTERLNLGTQFFSGKKFSDEGSVYLNLGYSYSLNGFVVNNQMGGKLGWQNSMVDVGVEGNSGTQKFSLEPDKVYPQYFISPSLDLWLNKKESIWRFKLGAKQEFSSFEFINGVNKRQNTTVTLTARHKNSLALSLGVGRFNFQTSKGEQEGYNLIPRIQYNRENLTFFAQGNLSYVDKAPVGSLDSNYILGQERYSGGLKYSFNGKHLLEARYIRAADGITNRESSIFSLGYTLKLGHQTKSILSILDSKKIYGNIYEDLNLNGVQDNNEEGIKGLKLKVLSTRGDIQQTTTDNQGYFKFSGLNEEVYSFVVENENNYSLSNLPSNINFKVQDSVNVQIPAVKSKNIAVQLEGPVEEMVMVVVNCVENNSFTNKVPAMIGSKVFISVPEKNQCSLSVDLLQVQNISYSPTIVDTKNNKEVKFKFASEKIILGQVYWDKNKNGFYELGEEITNSLVVFDKLSLKTDENGIFTSILKPTINKLKFIKVNGFKCFLRDKEISEFSSKKIISISCQK